MGACASVPVVRSLPIVADVIRYEQRKQEEQHRAQQKIVEEQEENERRLENVRDRAKSLQENYAEVYNEEPKTFSRPQDDRHASKVEGYDTDLMYNEFWGWRSKLDRLNKYHPLPPKDGETADTPEWQYFAENYNEYPITKGLAEEMRNKWSSEIDELRAKYKVYIEEWLNYALFDSSGMRSGMEDEAVKNWPNEWTPERLQQFKAEMTPKIEAADAERQKRKDGAYEVFCDARKAAWGAIIAQVSAKSDELAAAYDAWYQEQSVEKAEDVPRNKWEQRKGKLVAVQSSQVDYHEDIDYKADKWDTENFYEKAGDQFWYCQWSQELKDSWNRLSEKLEKISEELYAKYFPNNDCKYYVTHRPVLSPADNVGVVGDADRIGRTTYREFDSEEYRLYRGNFRSEQERLDYMRRMDTGGKHIGNGVYKTVSSYVNMPVISVNALCRKPQERDAVPLHFIVFPGGNCMNGIEL